MADLPQKLLIIIPAFNEAANIGRVIEDVKRTVPGADVVVVNDGSVDATAEAAEQRGVKVLTHPFNLGIGATMQTGYRYALAKGYDIAVQVDADGQHQADQVKFLLAPLLEKKADFVVGSRFLGRGGYRPSLARASGMLVFSKVVSLIIGSKMTDTTSGFRASGRKAIEFFSERYPDDYPEVETLVLLNKKGFNIIEVPVRMAERASGSSSITPIKSAFYMVKVLLAIAVDLLKKV